MDDILLVEVTPLVAHNEANVDVLYVLQIHVSVKIEKEAVVWLMELARVPGG